MVKFLRNISSIIGVFCISFYLLTLIPNEIGRYFGDFFNSELEGQLKYTERYFVNESNLKGYYELLAALEEKNISENVLLRNV